MIGKEYVHVNEKVLIVNGSDSDPMFSRVWTGLGFVMCLVCPL